MNAKKYLDLVKEGIHVDEDKIEEAVNSGNKFIDLNYRNISNLAIDLAISKINNYLKKFDCEENGQLYTLCAEYKETINGQVRFSLFINIP